MLIRFRLPFGQRQVNWGNALTTLANVVSQSTQVFSSLDALPILPSLPLVPARGKPNPDRPGELHHAVRQHLLGRTAATGCCPLTTVLSRAN